MRQTGARRLPPFGLARGDAPGRRSLNLGHTFAHAIESSSSTMVDVEGELLHPTHGEAVGLGLIAASALARELEWASSDLFAAVSQAVASAGLPTRLDCGLDVAALVEAMRHDKKACGGVLHLVVPTSEGVRIARDPGDGALLAAWMSLS